MYTTEENIFTNIYIFTGNNTYYSISYIRTSKIVYQFHQFYYSEQLWLNKVLIALQGTADVISSNISFKKEHYMIKIMFFFV